MINFEKICKYANTLMEEATVSYHIGRNSFTFHISIFETMEKDIDYSLTEMMLLSEIDILYEILNS